MCSELARTPSFIALSDATKAAYTIWALLYPSGDIAPLKHLAVHICKTEKKTVAIIADLQRNGFITTSPNGKLTLTEGWVRPHKTSASRVAKHRSKSDVDSNANVTPNVTLHTALQSGECNVTNGVSSKSQKEIPLINPLRKTSLTSANAEVREGARERATPQKTSVFQRNPWPENAVVPENWRDVAAGERQRFGKGPVDMRVVASKFERWAFSQKTPRSFTEWQAKFINFSLNEFERNHGSGSSKPSQIDQLDSIFERERLRQSGTFLEN